MQPCIDDSIIVTTLSPCCLNKFCPNSLYTGVLPSEKKDFLRGGCGCTQVKSREIGLGLILKNESAARRQLHYIQITGRPQTRKPQQIFKLFALHRAEIRAIYSIKSNFPEILCGIIIYIVPIHNE